MDRARYRQETEIEPRVPVLASYFVKLTQATFGLIAGVISNGPALIIGVLCIGLAWTLLGHNATFLGLARGAGRLLWAIGTMIFNFVW